jgi:2-dehydro-3-deoxyphosphogalactonate aldolase
MYTLDNDPCPLVAILRGLTAAEVPSVGPILFEAGFRLLEVPLNRPGALEAINALSKIAPSDALIGGGTMLTAGDVDAVKNAGGQFMVSPNCEPDVIRHAVACGMLALPGVCTPTEAFRALAAGAHGLKLFPAEMMPPAVVKALRSVLPGNTYLLPVGGIHPGNIAAYIDAGASGFGIGSQLYRPGIDQASLKRAAESFKEARQSVVQSARRS